MADLTELQRLAEGASRFTFTKDAHGWVQDCDTWELQDYIAAMSPDTAKKLIAVALAASENMGALEEATGYVMDGIRSPSLASEHRAAVAALRTALEELK